MDKRINFNWTFSPELSEGICPGISMVCCYPLRKGSSGNMAIRPQWALEYHSKYAGKLRLKNAPGWLQREADTVHVYAPGCEYSENTLEADLPIQETYIVFDAGPLPALEKMLDPKLKFARIHIENNAIRDLFMEAVRHCELYGDRAFWKTQSVLMQMIHLLSQARLDKKNNWRISEFTFSRSFSEQVEVFLRENIDQSLKTAAIAAYMKVSESTLNHKYKQETGISPGAKFLQMRIEFAKSLIMKGEKLKNIAEMTAFHDEYHLSKMFKTVTGVSPRKYREIKINL